MDRPKNRVDLAIVGAGVVGTFHAWHALQKGLSVTLFERDASPSQATVRNFGQVIPSGMALDHWHERAVYGSQLYRDIQQKFDITVRQQGSTYLASDEDEMTLLEELKELLDAKDYPSELLTKEMCLQRIPPLKSTYCVGGLFFPQEITVEPRNMISRLLGYLEENALFTYHPQTTIVDVESKNGKAVLTDSRSKVYEAGDVVICNGRDVSTLFPEVFEEAAVQICKLLMMQTKPQPEISLPGSILTGRSIRRYESFQSCPSYAAIKKREEEDEVKKAGIHILFKQATDGSVIVGDSHTYAAAGEEEKLGFDVEMDTVNLIVEEAQKILNLPHWEMNAYWAGYYAQHGSDVLEHSPAPHIYIATGIGGKGMTTSAGFARDHLSKVLDG